MTTTAMYRHVIEYVNGEGLPSTMTVAACYFTSDDDLMVFKNAEHKTVFAILRERLVYVERGNLSTAVVH